MAFLNPRDRMMQQRFDDADLLAMRNRPTQSPVTGLTVKANVGTYGAVISFSLGTAAKVKGFDSLRLLRSQGSDPATAQIINTWSITESDGGKNFSYADSDKSLANASTNYWIQAIPHADKQTNVSVTYKPIYAGPVNLAQLNGDLIAPDPITDFSVSLMPVADGVQVVTVAFKPTSDPRFSGVRVFLKGYEGNGNTVAIAESTYSPFQFNLNKTGETVTLYAYAVSVAGLAASSAPSIALTLNGNGTVPAKLENVQAEIINGETQIDFDAGLESNITSYRIYRGPYGAGFGSATVIQTVTPSGSNHYTVVDPQGLNAFYNYYVTAVNALGESAPSTKSSTTPSPQNLDQLADGSTYFRTPQHGPVILDNPNFEAATTLPPPGWVVNSSATLAYETGSPQSGKQSLKVTSSSIWAGARTAKQYQVVAGDSYKISGYMKSDGMISGRMSLNFYDGNGNQVGYVYASCGTGTNWNFFSATGTVPTNACYAILYLQNETSTAGTLWFDNIGVVRIASLDDEVWDGTTYFKATNYPSLAGGIDNGNFEASATILPPPGWAIWTGTPTVAYETASPQSGKRSLKLTGNNSTGLWAAKSYKVVPGEIYKLSGFGKGSGAAAGITINFFDVNGNNVGYMYTPISSSTWTYASTSGTVPAGAVYARIYCWITGGNGTVWFDNITVTKVASLDDEVADGSTYKRPKYVESDGTFHSSTVLKTQGSIIPSQPITINYTYNSNSISLSWGTQTMLASDGSTFTLNAGSTAYTGLAASTRYNIFPYISTTTGNMGFTNGSPPPSGTTPQTTLAIQQNLDGRIPTDPLFITTSASGSGGSGGTGGGGDVCPEASELVEVQGKGQIAAMEVVAGDRILGMNMYDGSDVWRTVIGTVTKECAAWRIVNGHKVSPCEPIWWEEQWLPAYKIPGAVFDGSHGTKVSISVEADNYDQFNYWLVKGNRLLLHNARIDPC